MGAPIGEKVFESPRTFGEGITTMEEYIDYVCNMLHVSDDKRKLVKDAYVKTDTESLTAQRVATANDKLGAARWGQPHGLIELLNIVSPDEHFSIVEYYDSGFRKMIGGFPSPGFYVGFGIGRSYTDESGNGWFVECPFIDKGRINESNGDYALSAARYVEKFMTQIETGDFESWENDYVRVIIPA